MSHTTSHSFSRIARCVGFCIALFACLLSSDALAEGAALGAATPEQEAQAKLAYQEGDKSKKAGRIEDALAAFRYSYSIVASPNSHFMAVLMLQKLGRMAEAYREAKLVVVEAEQAAEFEEKYTKTADAAQDKANELRASIGLLTVTVDAPDDSTLTVAGREIDRADWGKEIAVDPGEVAVMLTTPTGETSRTVRLFASGSEGVTVGAPSSATPDPEPDSERGPTVEEDTGGGSTLRTVSYVGFAIGGAGVVVFAIFGGLTLSEFSDLEEQCPSGSCSPEQTSEGDAGRGYQTAANVGIVVGAVGLATGLALLIADLTQGGDTEKDARRPQFMVGPGSLGIARSF